MCKILIFFLMLMTNFVFADEIEIRLDTKEPVMGDSFRVDFLIKTKSEAEPIINFDPLGVEVISRNQSGISTRSTYINGHLTVERTVSVSYELVGNKVGSAYLRNINVELNGKKLKHKNVRIRILRTAKQSKKVFVQAEVTKSEVFVGESIIVRYYLYSKYPVNTLDVKKFPKLDKFMKRFHQESGASRRVSYNNETYTRRIIYTSQIFPENPGTFKIDPISIGVRYSVRRNDPFQGFGIGFGMGKLKSASLRSKPIEIKVKKLPVNAPSDFTGLVGSHDFKIKINKNKFLANEPIEIKLSVEGEGALELFEAPEILDHQEIEEFESDVDLVVNKNFRAKKTFDYTYLGRGNASIKNQTISLSYFDPESMRFITKDLKLGDIKIAGVGTSKTVKSKKEQLKAKDKTESQKLPAVSESKFAPIYKGISSYIYTAQEVLIVIMGLVLIIVITLLAKVIKKTSRRSLSFYDDILVSGITYGKLHKLISEFEEGETLRLKLEKAKLPKDVKQYLENLVDELESEFSKGESSTIIKANKTMINKLIKYMRKNEKMSELSRA